MDSKISETLNWQLHNGYGVLKNQAHMQVFSCFDDASKPNDPLWKPAEKSKSIIFHCYVSNSTAGRQHPCVSNIGTYCRTSHTLQGQALHSSNDFFVIRACHGLVMRSVTHVNHLQALAFAHGRRTCRHWPGCRIASQTSPWQNSYQLSIMVFTGHKRVTELFRDQTHT